MIDYGRVREGEVLEIVGFGAPGYATAGDRVRVVHVGIDNIVVEDRAGRWAKFVGNQGTSRLRAADTESVNSSDQPRKYRLVPSEISMQVVPRAFDGNSFSKSTRSTSVLP